MSRLKSAVDSQRIPDPLAIPITGASAAAVALGALDATSPAAATAVTERAAIIRWAVLFIWKLFI